MEESTDSEGAYPRIFCKFDDREVETVVGVHVDDILAHAQATIEWFAAESRGKFKVKSRSASSGVSTLSQSGWTANP